ncbi:elongation factor 1-beta [Candidatus Woesearchaeota archaeon]|nr:elongation factor 1-beta [Candidatus Woesearchaeota archaeon]
MADVIVTVKIMPESPEVDLSKIQEQATKMISDFGGEVGKAEEQPIAFGLKALIIMFVMNESIGSTDRLEENIATIKGVNSVEVPDVRRAVG